MCNINSSGRHYVPRSISRFRCLGRTSGSASRGLADYSRVIPVRHTHESQGLGFQVKALKNSQVILFVPGALGVSQLPPRRDLSGGQLGISQESQLASPFPRVPLGLVITRGQGNVNLIQMSMNDKHLGSMKMTTHLDHISRCKSASGTNQSSRRTYRVFFINTRRDQIFAADTTTTRLCLTPTNPHDWTMYIHMYVHIYVYMYICIYI